MKLIITGGAGFIGSNFMYYQLRRNLEAEFICLDKLTYVGNLSSLKGAVLQSKFKFVRGDIAGRYFVYSLFEAEKPDFFEEIQAKHISNYVVCVIPNYNNDRIIAQQGTFLLYGIVSKTDNLDTLFVKSECADIFRKNDKYFGFDKLLNELESLGITKEVLFLELGNY